MLSSVLHGGRLVRAAVNGMGFELSPRQLLFRDPEKVLYLQLRCIGHGLEHLWALDKGPSLVHQSNTVAFWQIQLHCMYLLGPSDRALALYRPLLILWPLPYLPAAWVYCFNTVPPQCNFEFVHRDAASGRLNSIEDYKNLMSNNCRAVFVLTDGVNSNTLHFVSNRCVS